METHQRLAPCPAALEDRELGPSTGMEEEIEDSGGRDGVREGERRYACGRLVGFCARHRGIFTHSVRLARWVTVLCVSCLCLFAK